MTPSEQFRVIQDIALKHESQITQMLAGDSEMLACVLNLHRVTVLEALLTFIITDLIKLQDSIEIKAHGNNNDIRRHLEWLVRDMSKPGHKDQVLQRLQQLTRTETK